MPNRVALLRAEIEAAHPGAVMRHRGEAGFAMLSADQRWEYHKYTTGPWHWRPDGEQAWREIDTDLDPHEFGSHVRSARFDTLLSSSGVRRFIPRRWLPDEWVEFGRLQWQRSSGVWANLPVGVMSRQGNHLRGADHADGRLTVGFHGRGSRTSLTLKRGTWARPLRWSVTLNGLSWEDGVLISEGDGEQVGFIRPPTWTDSSEGPPVPHEIPWQHDGAFVTLEPDLSSAVYPVVVDPDYSIAAGADDGYTQSTSFLPANAYLGIGLSGSVYVSWMRFAGIVADQGADCSAATIAFVAAYSHSGTTVLTDFFGVDEDDHAAPTDYATWLTDHGIHTTATVAWDSVPAFTAGTTYTSPDLSTIFDEIFSRVGWATGQDAGVHWDDGGSSASAIRLPASYENTTYTEPVLSLTLAAAETNAQVSPACLNTVSSFPALTTAAGTTASPATLNTVSSFPAPTMQAGASFAVACLLTLSTFLAPTLAAGATTSPAALNTASSFPAVTTTAGSASSPALLDTTSEFPAPTVAAGQATSPVCLNTVTEWPAATATGESDAQTSPALLLTVSEFPVLTTAAGAAASPACLNTVSEFPAVTTAAGTASSPALLATVSEFPVPAVVAGQATQPACLNTASEFPAPTTAAGTGTSPAFLATASEFPAATLAAGSVISPAVLNTISEFPAPSLAAGGTTSPTILLTVSEFPAATIAAGAAASPACLLTLTEWPTPTTAAGQTTPPACLNTVCEWPQPAIHAGGAAPTCLNTTCEFPAVTIQYGNAASPACLNTVSEFPAAVARMRLQTTTVVESTEPSTSIISGEPSRTITSTLPAASITGRSRRASITSTEPSTHVDSETP